MPPPIISITPVAQAEVDLATLFTQVLSGQIFDERKEQEGKKVEFMMQPEKNNT